MSEALLSMQQRFSTVLRSPLVDDAGQLLPSELSVGMTAYHRQYWMRLFTVLQGQLPLLCLVRGATDFNVFAQEYLLAHAPTHRDLGELPREIIGFAESRLSDRERGALAIDWSFWRSFGAVEDEPLAVDAGDLASLAGKRLVSRSSVCVVWEGWSFMEARAQNDLGKLARLEKPAAWVVYRGERSVRFERLEPTEAKLLQWMEAMPLAEALTKAQLHMPPEELVQRVGGWLERAVRRKHWKQPGDAR